VNTFVIEEFFVAQSNACNFYTVRIEDREISETDHFYDNYEEHPDYAYDFGNINALINEIAERGQRIIRRNRDESRAFALPPKALINDVQIDNFENKLRLYYVPVSEDIIILLGGGIAHDEETGKPSISLWEAQNFAKSIQEAVGDAFLINGSILLPSNGEKEIIIY
jgi:hypothetical protein